MSIAINEMPMCTPKHDLNTHPTRPLILAQALNPGDQEILLSCSDKLNANFIVSIFVFDSLTQFNLLFFSKIPCYLSEQTVKALQR